MGTKSLSAKPQGETQGKTAKINAMLTELFATVT